MQFSLKKTNKPKKNHLGLNMWHLSLPFSDICLSCIATLVTVPFRLHRCGTHYAIQKEYSKKRRLLSSTWSVCWGLSQCPAGALKFRFIKNHHTLLNYKGFILSYSSLLEAGVDVVLFLLFYNGDKIIANDSPRVSFCYLAPLILTITIPLSDHSKINLISQPLFSTSSHELFTWHVHMKRGALAVSDPSPGSSSYCLSYS